MTLVGESGGLSSIYETSPSNIAPGLLVVTTEHGPLYLDPDETYPILALDQAEAEAPAPLRERLHLLVNNTDASGTGLIVVFRDEAHYTEWIAETDRVTADAEQPFGFRGEWGTTTRLLTPAEATALIVRDDQMRPSAVRPTNPEATRG